VINLQNETDINVLRQVALLQERENEYLHRRIGELVAALAKAQGQDATAQLQLELLQLKEQLAHAQQRLFGRSSERRPGPQTQDATEKTPAQPPRTGHGPRAQTALPLVEKVHTLDAPDQVCTACGGALTEMAGQFEESEEVDLVERSFHIVRHKRQKYRCACGGCIDTALGPPKLIPGGRYSVDFAVAVAVAKFLDHLPLHRQVRQMARAGLTIDTQTLWDQLQVLARHLAPSLEALHGFVLEAPVLGVDETRWKLLEAGGGKTWWAWSLCRPEAVVYRIDASRSAAAASRILRGYAGVIVCDGYSAYETLAKPQDDLPRVRLAHCWAHTRRKLLEAEPSYPSQLRQALDLIAKLYEIERALGDAPAAERLTVRQHKSRPLVEALRQWLVTTTALPQSLLGKAIAYTDSCWPGLVRFLDDPAIPLDNNATERALRGLVVGRKNHYGSKSQRGTEVAALFYSLLESAKLAGVDPAAYLAEATRRAIANPGTATLPQDLATA
jgi:transposase